VAYHLVPLQPVRAELLVKDSRVDRPCLEPPSEPERVVELPRPEKMALPVEMAEMAFFAILQVRRHTMVAVAVVLPTVLPELVDWAVVAQALCPLSRRERERQTPEVAVAVDRLKELEFRALQAEAA